MTVSNINSALTTAILVLFIAHASHPLAFVLLSPGAHPQNKSLQILSF